ncbi:MAG: hypothetical protein ACR2FV_10095 [Ornithinimicrobium sp.]|uniref:hypothetical protein n=1 Tax=Ornithinimicrobium sp. TaxID=1977084 RepID=UPI003D9AFE4E
MLAPRTLTALVLAAGLLVAGCGSQTETPSDAAPSTTSPQEFELSDPSIPPDDDGKTVDPIPPGAGALPLGPVPEAVTQRAEVQAAVADLAQRRDVPVEEVTVAGHAEVTWSDGSIGCPQKGMQYTMALVPGEQLILQVGDTYASYHKGKQARFSYCANPKPPDSGAASR